MNIIILTHFNSPMGKKEVSIEDGYYLVEVMLFVSVISRRFGAKDDVT